MKVKSIQSQTNYTKSKFKTNGFNEVSFTGKSDFAKQVVTESSETFIKKMISKLLKAIHLPYKVKGNIIIPEHSLLSKGVHKTSGNIEILGKFSGEATADRVTAHNSKAKIKGTITANSADVKCKEFNGIIKSETVRVFADKISGKVSGKILEVKGKILKGKSVNGESMKGGSVVGERISIPYNGVLENVGGSVEATKCMDVYGELSGESVAKNITIFSDGEIAGKTEVDKCLEIHGKLSGNITAENVDIYSGAEIDDAKIVADKVRILGGTIKKGTIIHYKKIETNPQAKIDGTLINDIK